MAQTFGNNLINRLCTATVVGLSVAMVVACIAWNLELPLRLGYAVLKQQYMAFQLGLALTLFYLSQVVAGPRAAWLQGVHGLAALVVFGTLMYTAWSFAWLLKEQAYRPWQIAAVGTVVVIAVMHGILRLAGNMLSAIVAGFFAYAFVADQVPGRLVGNAVSIKELVQYVGFDPSAVFGSPLAVGTVIVVLFVFFGQLLFAAGGGAFLTDLAMAVTGKSRGGSAKIAVVGSALFGSISGSAVSNVVTTGVITIPLMQRGGYSRQDAGAVEAVASTGGQLTPPIMGAAAFLMAEFLEVPYSAVAAAALIPAVLYYVSVFAQVDLIAGRDNIVQAVDARLSLGEVLQKGWHFLFPIAMLLACLFVWDMDPEDAAIVAAMLVLILGWMRGYGDQRLTWSSLLGVVRETAQAMVSLILIVAAAGFVIGVLNITGLGFALTLLLVDSVGSSTLLLLLVAAGICMVLGMGMPTSGVYVLLAALVAPALVEAGITPMAAHLFILYFGMLSMITPPVALASFAAATIAQASPLGTALASMRVGWASFVIPFVFVASPELLLDGQGIDIVSSAFGSVVGILGVTGAMVGFWRGPVGPVARVAMALLAGLALPLGLFPGLHAWHLPSAILLALVLSWLTFRPQMKFNGGGP
jgi:TRAP transporter 4TM/12TM fusion protein